MLSLKNVRKVYTTAAGDTAALDNLNLELPESGLVFITGKSGSGKTTLLNMIGGLDGLTSGDISIHGKSFATMTQNEYDSYRNTFVGFIFQEYNLLPEYTVRKNINIANELQGRSISKKDIDELLDLVGIAGLGERLPSELSGGQKQRVAIARALIKNPNIIMADEPTGALDSVTGIQVMEMLKKLSQSRLIVVVSHDLELAEKYADRIIRLSDGKVVEDVLLTETEIIENVYDSDPFCVRLGADLNAKETQLLLKAIREKRQISVIEKMSTRERIPTDNEKIKRVKKQKDIELIESKMKFKSSAGFGVKSLKSKPIRLAFTILLSVIAFAVFGVFDTVASYSEKKLITNTLKNSSFTDVAAVGNYALDDENAYEIKLNQETIDKINKKTGYNFKGVYEIYDTQQMTSTINKTTVLFDEIDAIKKGEMYYSNTLNGIVEFNEKELKDFGYKIIAGTYPTFDASGNNSYPKDYPIEIGISKYFAESIMERNGKGESFEFGGKTVEKIEDLVGCKLSTKTFLTGKMIITCIIDCGKIPSKYDEIKTLTKEQLQKKTSLNSDFTAFINSSAQKCLFVGEGFALSQYGYLNINNLVPRYLNPTSIKVEGSYGRSYVTYKGEYNATKQGKEINFSEFYKDTDLKAVIDRNSSESGVLYFDGSKDFRKLNSNEILISSARIDDIFNELLKIESEETKAFYEEYRSLVSNQTDKQIIENAFNDLINKVIIPYVFDGDTVNFENFLNFVVRQTYEDKTIESKTSVFKVVGIYYGVDKNIINSSAYPPIVLSAEGLKWFDIYEEQGYYSRVIAPAKFFGASKVATLMTNDEGLGLTWYNNSILSSISKQEEDIQNFFNLFIYVAIVLALFSMFMMFNYISSTIISKRPSIGVFRALGATVKDISIMFVVESLIIAIINAVLACVVTAVACIFVNSYIMQVMNIPLNFAMFDFRQVILITLASVLSALASSILPIIKICQEKPVALIRKV